MKLLQLLVVVLFGSISTMATDHVENSDKQELNLSEGASDGYFHGYFGSYGYPYSYSFGYPYYSYGYPYAYSFGYPYVIGYARPFNDYHLCIYFPDLPECSQMQAPAMGAVGYQGAGIAAPAGNVGVAGGYPGKFGVGHLHGKFGKFGKFNMHMHKRGADVRGQKMGNDNDGRNDGPGAGDKEDDASDKMPNRDDDSAKPGDTDVKPNGAGRAGAPAGAPGAGAPDARSAR